MGLIRHRVTAKDWDYFKDIYFFFESFHFYVAEINQFILKEIGSAKDNYEKFKKEVEADPTWQDEWFEYFANAQAKVGLTDIYYDSLIMSMYSFVEKKMFYLCNHLSQQYRVKVNDFGDNGIVKYRKYLSKVCDIDFAPIENDWSILRGYNKLRNHIVHSEGNRSIPKTNSDLLNFLKTIDGVTLNQEGDMVNFHFTTDTILVSFAVTAKKIIDHIYQEKL